MNKGEYLGQGKVAAGDHQCGSKGGAERTACMNKSVERLPRYIVDHVCKKPNNCPKT